jgi:hypothetical protein
MSRLYPQHVAGVLPLEPILDFAALHYRVAELIERAAGGAFALVGALSGEKRTHRVNAVCLNTFTPDRERDRGEPVPVLCLA